jgi:ubiquitin-protein ligase
MLKFTICLQFSSTKWAKAYLINYILEKLQENMGNMILCSLLMDNVAA